MVLSSSREAEERLVREKDWRKQGEARCRGGRGDLQDYLTLEPDRFVSRGQMA
jgi:hypothetical protein